MRSFAHARVAQQTHLSTFNENSAAPRVSLGGRQARAPGTRPAHAPYACALRLAGSDGAENCTPK